MEIRFSRHARNKLRLYKLDVSDVEEVIKSGEQFKQGNKWESRYDNLTAIWVMVGTYAFVITVIKTR
jgi:hypothetical protein